VGPSIEGNVFELVGYPDVAFVYLDGVFYQLAEHHVGDIHGLWYEKVDAIITRWVL
jgi:hypothetical protein